MRRLTILLILALWASPAWCNPYIGMMSAGVAAAAGGADAQIVAYFNCNANTEDQAMTKGTGNTNYTGDFTAVSGAVGNALYDNRGYYQFQIPTASNLSATLGTLGFYWRASTIATDSASIEMDGGSSPYFSFIHTGATNATWRYKTTSQSFTVAANTTYFIELAWDSTNNVMSYRVDGGSWTEVAATGTAPTLGSTLNFGNINSNASAQWFDQIMISSVYQKDLYAVRTSTNP